MTDFDVILAGGGLANGLIAERLAGTRPDLRVLVIEAGDRMGGNHTWCFHQSDVTGVQDAWLSKFTVASWTNQQVRFPAFRRSLDTGYRAITSASLDSQLKHCQPVKRLLSRRVTALTTNSVTLAGGETITAPCIIDGRGLQRTSGVALGFQKFVGLEIETREPHGLTHPIIMDATVAQIDGYRFFYCLPFSPTRLLVEDTYYSDDRSLDVSTITERVYSYIKSAGWDIEQIDRTETGVLPIMLDGSVDAFWPTDERIPRVGMRGALFHQTTGYSLPLAAHVAEQIATQRLLTTDRIGTLVRGIATEAWARQGFFRLLNRLLFISAGPSQRVDVMQRFYRLPHPLIERFYAGRLTGYDKARILSGRPPIPILNALRGMGPWSARGRLEPSASPPLQPGRTGTDNG